MLRIIALLPLLHVASIKLKIQQQKTGSAASTAPAATTAEAPSGASTHSSALDAMNTGGVTNLTVEELRKLISDNRLDAVLADPNADVQCKILPKPSEHKLILSSTQLKVPEVEVPRKCWSWHKTDSETEALTPAETSPPTVAETASSTSARSLVSEASPIQVSTIDKLLSRAAENCSASINFVCFNEVLVKKSGGCGENLWAAIRCFFMGEDSVDEEMVTGKKKGGAGSGGAHKAPFPPPAPVYVPPVYHPPHATAPPPVVYVPPPATAPASLPFPAPPVSIPGFPTGGAGGGGVFPWTPAQIPGGAGGSQIPGVPDSVWSQLQDLWLRGIVAYETFLQAWWNSLLDLAVPGETINPTTSHL